MKYLDTYVLAEIAAGNKACECYLEDDFVITDLTLVEFYWVLLRDKSKETADYWFDRLREYAVTISKDMLRKAMLLRHDNKKRNLSFFDCIGYVFAREQHLVFVTGDKEFKGAVGVEHIG